MSGTLRLLLTRDLPSPEHTYGVLSNELTGSVICQTLEPGTLDRDYPRIPTGFYALERHESVKYGSTVAMVGADVAHYLTPGIDRSACLIHSGNTDAHTRGCLIPGYRRGRLNGEPAVLESRSSLEEILELIYDAEFSYLRIR